MEITEIKRLEHDMLDIALYLQSRFPHEQPVIVFAPVHQMGAYPEMDFRAADHLETDDPWSLLLLYAGNALNALGYHPDDFDLLVMLDPHARHAHDSPARREQAVYRLNMMGAGEDG